MELTKQEQKELKEQKVITTSIDRFCDLSGVKKVDLANALGVKKQEIQGYRKSEKQVVFNPETKQVTIVTPQKEVKKGFVEL